MAENQNAADQASTLNDERATRLGLPPMVAHNTNTQQTAFTISIEAAEGVTTGVSAADRVTTVKAAVAEGARPEDLRHPGHVFPLRARPGGVLERRGHTVPGGPAALRCAVRADQR